MHWPVSAHNLARDYGFYNEKTLTVPPRNVSKLVRREDHLLNKPSILCFRNQDFNKFYSMTGECGNVIANSLEKF